MNTIALIVGLSGVVLTKKERTFLKKKKTLGRDFIFQKYRKHITVKKTNY